ncbi:mechanosensitive ion channel family protein [Methanothermococcus okinawensis]|uniref:MscS Mechanosensitive ion channel n=1 Tax=Methanothermococcus okinawensis (strain DSM 14208 / JCM 11175 / IH1) TaxID=647113 RepID=F8AMH4_METOI|nr:mechanosensitive ion channel family protein [Methanothermococcus okinawensis]AEH06014.1 MscS Mechanosensitive ion channel [Methanothermococcus okinawensis IH1]
MDFLNITYFGNPFYAYIIFILFIVFGIIFGKLTNFIVKSYVKRIVGKTKTKFDDIVLNAIEHPIVILVFTGFLYFGLKFLVLPSAISILLNEAIKIVVILCMTWFAVNFVDDFINYYVIPAVEKSETKFDDQIVPPLRKLLKILIIIAGLLMGLETAGYDITTLLAGLGIGGLAVALAAQDTVKNFIAGVLIFMDKPFRLNHWIRFDGGEGIVEDVGVRSTKIRTFDDSLIIVPNANLLGANIENLSEMRKRRVLVNIGLTYDTSVEKINKAKEIIKNIIDEHNATLPPIRITFKEFGDFSLNIRVEYFIRNFGFDYYLNTIDEINMKIKEEFEKEGIEMAFPTQTVYVKKDN